jgi:hypothetical protein
VKSSFYPKPNYQNPQATKFTDTRSRKTKSASTKTNQKNAWSQKAFFNRLKPTMLTPGKRFDTLLPFESK